MENTETNNISTDGITVTSTGSTTIVTTDNINVPSEDTKAEETTTTTDTETVEGEGSESTQETTTETEDDSSKQEETSNNVQETINKHLEAEKDLKSDLSSKGIDWDALTKEYDGKGELSKETLDALDKAGYPKSVVDNYISGLEAISEKFVNEVKGFAGGDKGYDEVVSYLQKQPDSVKKDFNDVIESGNLGAIKLVIKGIQSEMKATYGTSNPTMMRGQASRATQVGFATQNDMVKAMSDPRYGVDKKYTDEVYAKVAKTSFIG